MKIVAITLVAVLSMACPGISNAQHGCTPMLSIFHPADNVSYVVENCCPGDARVYTFVSTAFNGTSTPAIEETNILLGVYGIGACQKWYGDSLAEDQPFSTGLAAVYTSEYTDSPAQQAIEAMINAPPPNAASTFSPCKAASAFFLGVTLTFVSAWICADREEEW